MHYIHKSIIAIIIYFAMRNVNTAATYVNFVNLDGNEKVY